MCGNVPFGEDSEDPYEIYQEIFRVTIKYPNFLKDRKAKKLMDQLINKVPEVRWSGSYAALKGNAWFDDLDWEKLADYQVKPPYIPKKESILSDEKLKAMIEKSVAVSQKIESDYKAMGGQQQQQKVVSSVKNWDEMF